MTARKAAPNNDAARVAALATTSPAAFAKAIGKDPKALRTVLRSRLGIHVSKGDAFTDEVKATLFAHYVEGDAAAITTYRDAHPATA